MKLPFSLGKKTYTTLAVFVFCIAAIHPSINAQTLINSPYSRYGLGDIQLKGFTQQLAMGGITYGLRSPVYININSPASYASIKITTFEVGIRNTTVEQHTSTLKQTKNSTSLSYVALAFPVTNWWGGSFGLTPYSSVGYKISNKETLPNIGEVNYLFEGSGGTNQVFIGNAFSVFKNLSIGFNASYLFGELNKERRAIFPSTGYYFNTKEKNTIDIGGFDFQYGLQYKQNLKKEYSLTFGATMGFASSIKAKRTILSETYAETNDIEVIKDTSYYSANNKGTINLPQRIGFGIVLKKSENFLMGIDYTMQQWNKFSIFGESDSLVNSSTLALGAQYTPDVNPTASFFKKIQYRAGTHYSKSYLKLKGTQINETGITVGFALPLKKTASTINFSFEIGQRGTVSNNLIQEKYGMVTLGVTINDRWFIKSKFD